MRFQNLAASHCVTIRIQTWICDLKYIIRKYVALKKQFKKKQKKKPPQISIFPVCVTNLWGESTLTFTLPLSTTQLNDYPLLA